jgi:hypothetical protein
MLKFWLLLVAVVGVTHMETQALVVAVEVKLKLARQHLVQHLK